MGNNNRNMEGFYQQEHGGALTSDTCRGFNNRNMEGL
jgi:hypothetical protein